MTFCLILTGAGLLFTGMSSSTYVLAIMACLIGIGGGPFYLIRESITQPLASKSSVACISLINHSLNALIPDVKGLLRR